MTMRSVQDRFWSDGWVRKLNALDRYLFLYLITNEHTNWCGVYELDLAMMAFESGIDKEELDRTMLPRLVPKVIYTEGWVYIPNWVKHHMSESGNLSPTQKEGISKAWEKVPERIRLKIKETEEKGIPYVYPIGGVSASASSLSSSFSATRVAPDYEIEEKPRTPAKYPHKKEVFSLWGKYPRNWDMNSTHCKASENLYQERGLVEIAAAIALWREHKDDQFCPDCSTPYKLDSNWISLHRFKVKNGL